MQSELNHWLVNNPDEINRGHKSAVKSSQKTGPQWNKQTAEVSKTSFYYQGCIFSSNSGRDDGEEILSLLLV